MSEFIEFLSPSALTDLQKGNAELVTMIKNVDVIGQKMSKISTPSGSDSAIKQLTIEYQKQEKVIQSLQLKIQSLVDKKEKENNTIAKTMKALENETRARQSLEKQRDREIAKLNASQQLYSKVQSKLNLLASEYKQLAVQKELTGKLTDTEAKRYDFLLTKITKYDTVLKAVDATTGKYQRNVGNYAIAFNPLSNSINQLTREMPAFVNSVQTGFMAISNNLPIFFDAIQGINAQNKILLAEGKPTTSVLKQLGASFLSIGTALSVGITLLTIFGDEIVDSIFSTKAKAKADEEAKKALDDKNDAEKKYLDTIKNTAGEEISRSQILFENAKNVNLSMKDRLKAISELKERYPDYLKELSKEEILAGNTAIAENALNEALVKRGIAIGLQTKLTEEYNKLAEVLLKINNIERQKGTVDKDALDTAKKLGVSAQQLQKDKAIISRLSILQYQNEQKEVEKSIQGILALYNEYSPYLSVVQESTNAIAENNKEKEKQRKGDFLSKEQLQSQISKLEEELSLISILNPAYKIFSDTLKGVTALYDALYGSKKKVAEEDLKHLDVLKGLRLAIKGVNEGYDEGKEKIDDYLKTFTDSFAGNSGLPTLFKILNDEVFGFGENFAVTFNTVAELAQETFNKISEFSNQNFENEYNNLAKQKEIAMAFAGDSESAKEEIERQSEQRRKEIARREFKAKQKIALFNIAIDTAQAIVATLTKTPLPAGLPLVIATSAIGALQLGIVASQQPPQFWKGTDNAPEGFAYTQERGAEVITDSKGNIKDLGDNKGARLTYLTKGDKVFTAEKTASMFDNNLNSILSDNGIMMPKVEISMDTQSITNEIKSLANTIANKESFSIVRDARGERVFRRKQAETKELMNNILEYKGINI